MISITVVHNVITKLIVFLYDSLQLIVFFYSRHFDIKQHAVMVVVFAECTCCMLCCARVLMKSAAIELMSWASLNV